MKTKKLIVLASLMCCALSLVAQPQEGRRQGPPKMKTPEEIAKKEAGMMQAELGLSDKQYKKVYKLVKKDQEYRRSQMENQFGGMPPQGGPGGGFGGPDGGFGGGPGGGGMMGGPGGGMMGGPGGGMMGGPGGGGFGGQGGGMPPQGEMGRGPAPDGAPGMNPDDLVTEEYLEKQEKKLKKILSNEQYSTWRAKHPAEHVELPPMEFK